MFVDTANKCILLSKEGFSTFTSQVYVDLQVVGTDNTLSIMFGKSTYFLQH